MNYIKLTMWVVLSTLALAKSCIIVDTSASLYKGSTSSTVIREMNNDDFAKSVIHNDERKRTI